MDIYFAKSDNRIMYRKGNKGKYKELTEQRALGCSLNDAVELLEYYTASHHTWSADKLPPSNVYENLVLSSKNAQEFLMMLVMIGNDGIYWNHDWESKTVTLAFENEATKIVAIERFKMEIDRRLTRFKYKENNDSSSKFDLKSIFKR